MSLVDNFSVQLYSLRDETCKDFFGVLKKLSEIGYYGVEFAGYEGISAEDMAGALNTYGLKTVGNHVGLDRLENNLEEEIEYNKTIGAEYIICPWYELKTEEQVAPLAEKLNKIENKIKEAGMTLGYHNHAHEFTKVDDTYLLDSLFKALNPSIVMELDLYWAAYAGVDYLSYMEKHKDRLKLLHIKQIKDFESKKCVDLNEGVLDFKKIITTAKTYGVKHFILEQEEFAISPFVSVENGYNYIKSL